MWIEIIESATLRAWFTALRDPRGRSRVLARIRRLSLGNPGDMKPVGGGILEMCIPVGPGYRVYLLYRHHYAVLLVGGDKSTQRRDIAQALTIAAEWRE